MDKVELPYVAETSLPKSLTHANEHDAKLDAMRLLAFVRWLDTITVGNGDIDAPDNLVINGLGLVYDLLEDKLRICFGDLPFPYVKQVGSFRGKDKRLSDLLQAGAAALSFPPEKTTHDAAASEVQEAVARLEKLRENMVIMSCSGGGVVPEIFDKTAATLADVIALLKKTSGV